MYSSIAVSPTKEVRRSGGSHRFFRPVRPTAQVRTALSHSRAPVSEFSFFSVSAVVKLWLLDCRSSGWRHHSRAGSCNSQQKLPASSLVPNMNDYHKIERKDFRGRQIMNPFVACQMVSLPKEALLFGEVDVQSCYVEELRGNRGYRSVVHFCKIQIFLAGVFGSHVSLRDRLWSLQAIKHRG